MARFLSVSGAPGDAGAAAETMTLLASIERTGGRLSELARIRFFYSAVEEVAALTAVRREAFPPRFPGGDFPAATGVITGGRPGGPRLEAQAVLVPDPAATRRRVQPDALWSVVGGQALPVSHGIAVDGVLFISGQVPYDPGARLVGADSPAQIDQALANLEAVLAEAGADRADVLGFTVYHVVGDARGDADARAHFHRRVSGWSPQPAPVAWVGVRELFQPGLAIEIEATAALAGATGWSFATATVPWGDPRSATRTGCEALMPGGVAVGPVCGTRPTEAAFGGTAASNLVTLWCPDPAALDTVAACARECLPGAVITAVPLATATGGEPALVLEAISRAG